MINSGNSSNIHFGLGCRNHVTSIYIYREREYKIYMFNCKNFAALIYIHDCVELKK